MITYVSSGQSIQAVIDDPCTVNGDKIEVAPGTYYESINFNGKAVHLYSSDGPDSTTIDANGAYHAVQCISGEGANTILEGFTISGGDASGTYPDDCGGGMYNNSSSPTVTNCNFSSNSADYAGGGMYCENSSPTVTNCIFSNNTGDYGGGMCNYDYSSPTVTNCIFNGNSAYYGGGMYNCEYSSPTVTDCNFSSNSADYAGGGMFNVDHSSPTVTNCIFSNNTGVWGGGMSSDWYCSPKVTNCTFSSNTAVYNGGGMANSSYCSPTVTNCILWGDSPNEIYIDNSTATVSYSEIQGGGYPDANNINADPCFIDANAGDLRLRPDSLCIDAGNNTAVPSSVLKDLVGKLRFADDPCTPDIGYANTNNGRPVVDMGAYEFQGCGAIPQNLLANPGFETGDATGWMSNWGLAADTNPVHDGNYSGLASGRTATWDGAWQSLLGLMDDGKTYRISGWVMLQNADSNYVQLTVKKTDLGGTNFYFIDNATGFDDQWVHLDGTLAVDLVGQPTELYVYFEGPVPDVNFYVDDASVTEVMGDMNHNGCVNFIDFALFASYYGLDCSTQDCGPANLYDCDKAINERDLAIWVRDWLVGTE
jgi:hypothetical protein